MSQQPEALRLAALLESGSIWEDQEQAATELRRLHEINHELLEALRVAVDSDLGRLWVWPQSARETWFQEARAAIAKAEGWL